MNNETENPKSGSQLRGKLPGGTEIKEYGKKSLSPLINLVSKYKNEISPYFVSIGKGLSGAADSLGNFAPEQGENSGDTIQTSTNASVEQTVSDWFREAANWFEGANKRLETGSAQELLDYLEEQAKKHPAIMFSSSYIVGLLFGRIGRHIGHQYSKRTDDTFEESFTMKH